MNCVTNNTCIEFKENLPDAIFHWKNVCNELFDIPQLKHLKNSRSLNHIHDTEISCKIFFNILYF